MQHLELAVRQIFEQHRLSYALLCAVKILEAHDALVGGQRRYRLTDVMAGGAVQVGLDGVADAIQVERQ
ncbi:hypothetical protein D3C86_2138120 [compost metagenome]